MTIQEALAQLPPDMKIMCLAEMGTVVRTVTEELERLKNYNDPTNVAIVDQKYNYGKTVLKAIVIPGATLYREAR